MKDKPNHNIHGKLVVHVPVVENGVLLNIAEKVDTKRNFVVKLTNVGNFSIEDFVYDFFP